MQKIDTPQVLVVDPDPDCQSLYQEILADHGARAITSHCGREALDHVDLEQVDVVLTELQLEDMDGLELLAQVQAANEDAAVILMTAFASVADAVEAMRHGAADFLTKPFSAEQLCLAIDKATRTCKLIAENNDLKEALDDRLKIDNMIATDPRMQRVLKAIKAVAKARTTVLITGESGTGKTLLARAIHQNSPRHEGPFVEVNCGALPENLLESELFGHVRGSFTGAVKDHAGKFAAANQGTIFLDEIGTSSPGFQIKLLRVLQDRVIERVGDTKTVPVDVRVVLATNLNLEEAVAEGRFRQDLYYRIQVVSLEMPPLRERRGDIASLAEHFLVRYAAETGRAVHGFSRAALDLLVDAPWPGNVRQLENVVERAVVLTEHERIQPEDLPANLLAADGSSPSQTLLEEEAHLRPLKEGLEGPERVLIQRALAHHNGNRKLTAASLGINRSTLFNKMRKYRLL